MNVYIINFIVLILIGFIVERFKHNKVIGWICYSYSWLQLTLLAALRWGIGYDYNQYFNTFYRISSATGWSELLQRREEIGFLFFNRCMSYITENIIVYLFFYYGIMYALLIWYIYKHSERKWCSVAIFLAFDYFAVSLCFMRQSMAMVIGLYVVEMIKKRKWYWAMVLTLLATLFHSSAFILLVGLIFSYLDFTRRKVQIIAVGTALVLYIGCDFFLEHVLVGPFAKYADYLESPFMMSNHIFAVYYPILVFLLVAFYGKKLCAQDKEFKRLIPVLFLGTFLALLTTKHYIIERMSLYITFYNIRVVAQILALYKKEDKWNYGLATSSAIIVSIFAFIFSLMNDRYGILPYQRNEYYMRQRLFKESRLDNEVQQSIQAKSLTERMEDNEKNQIFINFNGNYSSSSNTSICWHDRSYDNYFNNGCNSN